jgi:hypothetical protein
VIAFSHEQPQDFGLSGSVGMLTPAVMAKPEGCPPRRSIEGPHGIVSSVSRRPA